MLLVCRTFPDQFHCSKEIPYATLDSTGASPPEHPSTCPPGSYSLQKLSRSLHNHRKGSLCRLLTVQTGLNAAGVGFARILARVRHVIPSRFPEILNPNCKCVKNTGCQVCCCFFFLFLAVLAIHSDAKQGCQIVGGDSCLPVCEPKK